jgi:dTDP-4-amino-4,6-dideoxygalactose transaminase
MNIDPTDVKRKITRRTKAIIPVHFAGRPCDMDSIMSIARQHKLIVIEDCAHAIEAEYHREKVGTIGDIGCFSFYVTKNIITGEGGMVITNNEQYADRIKILGLHGLSKDAWSRFSDSGYKHYQIVDAGYKYNMMDIQAAIGIHQLPRIEFYWKKRRSIWNKYNGFFRELPVFMPLPCEPKTKHAFHLYTLLLDIDRLKITRDQFLDEMTKRDIGTAVHYIALHLHPFYQKMFKYKRCDFPSAEWISERTISLPLSPKLREDDVKKVIRAVITIARSSS